MSLTHWCKTGMELGQQGAHASTADPRGCHLMARLTHLDHTTVYLHRALALTKPCTYPMSPVLSQQTWRQDGYTGRT